MESWTSGLKTGESIILKRVVPPFPDFSLSSTRENCFCDQRTSVNKVILAISLKLTVHRMFDEIARNFLRKKHPCLSTETLLLLGRYKWFLPSVPSVSGPCSNHSRSKQKE
jgi:hypothetical protein